MGITAAKQPIEAKNTRHKEVSLLANSLAIMRFDRWSLSVTGMLQQLRSDFEQKGNPLR